VARLNNDLLYQDCTLSATADLNAPKEFPPACDSQPNNDERNRVAQFYPGKLVVYLSKGASPRYDETAHRWRMDAPRVNSNWSNHVDWFVLMSPGDPGHTLAHEIGHYLHLLHSFGTQPNSLDDTIGADGKPALGARTLIRNYVLNNGLPKAAGVKLFDADDTICASAPTILCVADTPPDPGPALFRSAGLDPCDPSGGTLTFSVQFPDGPFIYRFTPDRNNVMNYWEATCPRTLASISPDQVAGVRAAVMRMNRQHLIAKRALYTAVWEPGNRDTSRAIGWGMQDFAARFNTEIAAGRHLVHMQAYDLGGGQIRWDGVWEAGQRKTSRAIGWGMQDFAARFNREIAAGRHLVHMQAYDLGGGQIRYDGVWEAGRRGTDCVIGWGFNDLVRHLEQEDAAGRTLVHLQPYDIGDGQIRYDGVWENNPAGRQQTRILAETIYPFAARFNTEVAGGRHLVMMQTVIGR
jgi:Polyglycine hydrolase-like, structural repeat